MPLQGPNEIIIELFEQFGCFGKEAFKQFLVFAVKRLALNSP